MENALVSSFYWDLDRQMEVIESKEPYYNGILDSNISLLNKISCIDANVDITQRQKARMISNEIANFTDTLQVVIAILDSQFNQLAFILTPETPLEFDVKGVTCHFFINGLKGETRALFIEDYNTFVPLNRLTKAETVLDVLSGKVHFEDLTSSYDKIKHENLTPSEVFFKDVVRIDGWAGFQSVDKETDWFSWIFIEFFTHYTADEQFEIIRNWALHKMPLWLRDTKLQTLPSSEGFNHYEFKKYIENIPYNLSRKDLKNFFELLTEKANARAKGVTYRIHMDIDPTLHLYAAAALYRAENTYLRAHNINLSDYDDYLLAVGRDEDFYKHTYA